MDPEPHQTTYEHLMAVVCGEWERSQTLMQRAVANGMTTTAASWCRAGTQAEADGKIKRRKVGAYFEFQRVTTPVPPKRRGPGRPRKIEEKADSKEDKTDALHLPTGATHLSVNCRDWFKPDQAPDQPRYARTRGGKYYRRVNPQDRVVPMHKRWLPVTRAHIECVGRERWFG